MRLQHARAAGNGAIDLGEVLLELRSYEFRNAIGAVGVFARFDSENVAHWLRVAADFADEGGNRDLHGVFDVFTNSFRVRTLGFYPRRRRRRHYLPNLSFVVRIVSGESSTEIAFITVVPSASKPSGVVSGTKAASSAMLSSPSSSVRLSNSSELSGLREGGVTGSDSTTFRIACHNLIHEVMLA
nr:hypothetical protein Iba_chr06aCG5540 [Ipomoea batatas]